MFFSSVEEKNRLLSKGVSNIYLKVAKQKFSKLQFSKTKKFCPQVFSFWRAPTHAGMIKFSNFLLQLKNQRSGSETVCRIFYYFNFERVGINILEGIVTF